MGQGCAWGCVWGCVWGVCVVCVGRGGCGCWRWVFIWGCFLAGLGYIATSFSVFKTVARLTSWCPLLLLMVLKIDALERVSF